jgi:hypothetical protein
MLLGRKGGVRGEVAISSLTAVDIKVVGDLVDFIRGRGYVLDFSDREMSHFFGVLGINIDAPIYAENGGSKGNRLRTFLRHTDDQTSGLVLKALWDHRVDFLVKTGQADPIPNAKARFLAVLGKLNGTTITRPTVPPLNPRDAVQHELQTELFRIRDLSPQRRGYAFEALLTRYFEESGLRPREPFRNSGEQIDGSFILGTDVYLVEAKYEANPTGAGDLHAFHGKVTDKASWTRGLFVAFEGFTNVGLEAFGRGKRIILMTGRELHDALGRRIPLAEVLERKVRAAAETGRPFTPLPDLFR